MKVWSLLLGMCSFAVAHAQVLGTVPIADASATSSGHLADVAGGRASLSGSSVVVAKDHTAEVSLARGGSVRLCQTSGLHLAGSSDTLLLGLDRGAMEIRMKAGASDVVMTPDLRFTMPEGGALDLRIRVTRTGDTCVENRGHKAPALMISDAFGEASYQVKPGQHVMFEHGSLREVVDRETTPCGCPPDEVRAVPLAEAVLHGGAGAVTPRQAEAAHPFPAAQSEGLAEPAPLPAEAPGVVHTQVATTLAFDPTAPKTPEPPSTDNAPPLPAKAQPATSSVAPHHSAGSAPFRAVGRFFKRIFVR